MAIKTGRSCIYNGKKVFLFQTDVDLFEIGILFVIFYRKIKGFTSSAFAEDADVNYTCSSTDYFEIYNTSFRFCLSNSPRSVRMKNIHGVNGNS